MKKKSLGKKFIKALFLALFVVTSAGLFNCSDSTKLSEEKYTSIQDGFTVPNDTNTVWCYYYWIGDDISKEGVTKDLEAMKKFGIGTVLIGNINPDEVDGPVPLFSDTWWEIMVHTVNEGRRLGIDVGNFNSPGWSQSGGPWISYDKAMRHLVYSESSIGGGKSVQVKLDQPEDEFQDTYVLAFKSIEAENFVLDNSNATIKTEPAINNPSKLLDGDFSTAALFSLRKHDTYTINIESDEAITSRSIILYPGQPAFKTDCELYAFTDGEYRLVKSFVFDRSNTGVNVGPVTHGPVSLSIPPTTSNKFRLVCSGFFGGSEFVEGQQLAGFSEIIITEGVYLEKYVEKSMGKMHPTPFPDFYSYMWDTQEMPADENLTISEVIDLSDKMDDEGVLRWDAPEGTWTVLRLGMTSTGTKNSPAAPQGKGYEVDKASEEFVRDHFKNYIGELLDRIPEESKPAFKYVVADSYEMGSQNWTDGFEETFKEKFGYDPVRYLPVLSGRIVGTVEESDRFLWDLRRAMADEIAYEYVGGLRKISKEHNMKLWLENYGHWGYPGEFLMYGGQSDLISGEFWNEGELGNIECKSASSAAHIYGKPVTYAEAYTAGFKSYERHPAKLKKRGDWSFTEGINHMVLHVYIHQPDDERVPGINAWFSTEFNRHNTWFEQGKEWVDYLRRNQQMLQQGKYAADVCYFIGEDVPKMTGTREPELPEGYSYDYINAEVILDRLSVENGSFILPDGMKYKLLVLPNITTMRPEVIEKIEELVRMGGTVLGPKPNQSPSLENYPESDEKVREIADRLWTNDYQNGKLIHEYGKGYLVDGAGIQEVLDLINVPADVSLGSDVPVLWTHRTLPGMEIYFLTNQGDEEISFNPTFRVDGLEPQLWNAITGDIRVLNEYSIENGKTTVPIKMKPAESMYIVFTNQRNEKTGLGYESNFPEGEILMEIAGNWLVEFNNKDIGPSESQTWENLKDWTKFGDDKIRYYSGTAVYKTSFEIDELPGNSNFYIDLGDVGVMATVELNGEKIGGTWMAPFILPAKEFLKEGNNEIEIEVVNIWRNRMVKEDPLPKDERYTFTIVEDVEPDEELTPSGLMGPVVVKAVEKN
ncbi:MAG: glycosyl hydrolase [Bacteroidales bacterium]|nr:glycosyl hydrolase [Bacteroidales bacterium]MDT8402662.1 glycosyl hydrolase [Bacteroidales bacterium]